MELPDLVLALDESYKPLKLELSLEEAKALDDYFHNRAGYISHEFDGPLFILIKKITAFIKEREK